MSTKSVQISLVIAALMITSTQSAKAQQVMKVNGNPCVGTTITFALTQVSCSSVSWYANGGAIINQTPNSVDVRWDSPTSNAWVEANYSSCSYGTPGTRSSAAFTIGYSVTPSVSITATQNNAYPVTTVTFMAIPVNGGVNPNYTWFVNGTGEVSGISATFSRANLVNGDAVSVKMFSNASCTTSAQVTSNSIVTIIPVANAGEDVVMTLPQNATTLHGTGSDADGSVVGYKWTKISGPAITLPISNTPDVVLSKLIAGTYVFKLEVWDNMNYTSLPDQVTLTVNYPENNYNWIKETTVLVPGITGSSQVNSLVMEKRNTSWSYVDGLGKPIQLVAQENSPLGRDIVTPMAYDMLGREVIKYLPYVQGNNGYFNADFVEKDEEGYDASPQYQFYQTTDKVSQDTNPFSQTEFEASPLNRVIKQGAPGEAWQPIANEPLNLADKTVKMQYEFNKAGDEVILFEYDEVNEELDLTNGITYYDPNELYANKTLDEHNNEVIEFVDKQGRTVLKKVQHDEEGGVKQYASTYYIYDDFGNLVIVIPPQGVKNLLDQF